WRGSTVAHDRDPYRRRTGRARHIAAPEDTDHPRLMPEGRDLGQERRLDVLSGDEELDRLDPGVERSVHEILTLSDEEPELVAPAAILQLANELELLVVERGDQTSHSSQAPWKSACASSPRSPPGQVVRKSPQ